jgi:hypothetical protein
VSTFEQNPRIIPVVICFTNELCDPHMDRLLYSAQLRGCAFFLSAESQAPKNSPLKIVPSPFPMTIAVPERTFKILAYVDKVPSLASCTKCQHKFFTPRDAFRRDPDGAENYLREKFVRHDCPKQPKDVHTGW